MHARRLGHPEGSIRPGQGKRCEASGQRKLRQTTIGWDLKVAWKEKGLPEINIGSGVNTGTCIVGNMGSTTRFDYSVIGDAVNLAARLEASTRNYHKEDGSIVNTIYSSYTQEQLPNDLKGVEIDKIKVKGKDELVTIFKPR